MISWALMWHPCGIGELNIEFGEKPDWKKSLRRPGRRQDQNFEMFDQEDKYVMNWIGLVNFSDR